MLSFRVERFDTVVSTNQLVKQGLEKDCEEGLVCRAAEQIGGYGRQGRIWVSPRGGLYQSLLLRPSVSASQISTLSLVVALAVREALLKLGSLPLDTIQVKWPNDVVCAEGKLVGISLETHAGGVCVGIGINVFCPADEASVGGKNTPVYLSELVGTGVAPSIDAVGDAVLDAFSVRYSKWCQEGFASFVDEFNACNALAGKSVDIVDRNGKTMKSGLVTGVDAQGNLLVNGAPVASGEAHLL